MATAYAAEPGEPERLRPEAITSALVTHPLPANVLPFSCVPQEAKACDRYFRRQSIGSNARQLELAVQIDCNHRQFDTAMHRQVGK